MKPSCPNCGSPLHETKKRAYQCGTWENSEGAEYQTVPCSIASQAIQRSVSWATIAENADAARELAEKAKEKAEEESMKDRAFAQEYHIRLKEETDRIRQFYLSRVADALGLPEVPQALDK